MGKAFSRRKGKGKAEGKGEPETETAGGKKREGDSHKKVGTNRKPTECRPIIKTSTPLQVLRLPFRGAWDLRGIFSPGLIFINFFSPSFRFFSPQDHIQQQQNQRNTTNKKILTDLSKQQFELFSSCR